MKALIVVLCALLACNIVVMAYHGYRLTQVTSEIESIKEVGRSVRDAYTILGGSLSEKATLAREKIAKIPTFLQTIKEKIFASSSSDETKK